MTRPECDGLSLLSIVVKPLPKAIGGDGDLIGTTRAVWQCAEAYRSDHPAFVLAAFAIVYIVFQTFAIPGPIVLSILSGALYPRWVFRLLRHGRYHTDTLRSRGAACLDFPTNLLVVFASAAVVRLRAHCPALAPSHWPRPHDFCFVVAHSLQAQVLVACCATTGATLCYLISNLIGREIMHRVMPKMLATFREKVRGQRAHAAARHVLRSLIPCDNLMCAHHGNDASRPDRL